MREPTRIAVWIAATAGAMAGGTHATAIADWRSNPTWSMVKRYPRERIEPAASEMISGAWPAPGGCPSSRCWPSRRKAGKVSRASIRRALAGVSMARNGP